MLGQHGGIRIGRLFGIDIVADVTWFLMVVFVFTAQQAVWDRRFAGQATAMAITATIGFFLAVLIHELAHSVVALARKLPVKRIRLFIFGGVSELEEPARSPADEFFVTFVGPLSNGVLALAFWLAARAAAGGAATTTAVAAVCGYLAWVNIALGIFNLLPAWPLDGGKVLQAGLWAALGDRRRATAIAARCGKVLGGLMLAFGAYALIGGRDRFAPGSILDEIARYDLSLLLVGFLIMRAATGTATAMRAEDSLAGMTVGDLMWNRPVAVHPDERLAVVARMFADAAHPAFPVVDSDGRAVGMLTVGGAKALSNGDPESSHLFVHQAMEPLGPTVNPWQPALDAVDTFKSGGGQRVVVVDAWGRLVGLLVSAPGS